MLLFLPDKVYVFLVSNSQIGLGWEAFLNPSQHSFEFPSAVPVAGGGGGPAQGGACLVSLLSFCPGSSVAPAPSHHCPHPSWAAFFPSRKPEVGGMGGEPEALYDLQSPSSQVIESHNRGSTSYLT